MSIAPSDVIRVHALHCGCRIERYADGRIVCCRVRGCDGPFPGGAVVIDIPEVP